MISNKQQQLMINKKAKSHMKEALSLVSKELTKFELLGLEYSIYPRLLRATQALKHASNQYQNNAYFKDIKRVASDIDQIDSLGLLPYLHSLQLVKQEVKQIYQLSACIDRDFKSLRKAIKHLKKNKHRVEHRHHIHWQKWCKTFRGVGQWSVFEKIIVNIMETIHSLDKDLDVILKGLLSRTISGKEMSRAVKNLTSSFQHILYLSGTDESLIVSYSHFRKYFEHIRVYHRYQTSLLPTHPFRFCISMFMKQAVLLLFAIMLWFHHPLVASSDSYFVMVLIGVVGSDLIRTAFATRYNQLGQWLHGKGKQYHQAIVYIDLVQALGVLAIAGSFILKHDWSASLILFLLAISSIGLVYLFVLSGHYLPDYRSKCAKVQADLQFLHQFTQASKGQSLPLRKRRAMVEAMRGRLHLVQCGHQEYLHWCLEHLDLGALAYRVA